MSERPCKDGCPFKYSDGTCGSYNCPADNMTKKQFDIFTQAYRKLVSEAKTKAIEIAQLSA